MLGVSPFPFRCYKNFWQCVYAVWYVCVLSGVCVLCEEVKYMHACVWAVCAGGREELMLR